MENSTETRLVKELVNEFIIKGLEVTQANCGDFKNPEPIREQKPDVIAWDPEQELYHIGLVTEQNNMEPENVRKKIQILSNLMMSNGHSENKRVPFYLGVPKGQSEKISEILDNHDISRDNILTVEV